MYLVGETSPFILDLNCKFSFLLGASESDIVELYPDFCDLKATLERVGWSEQVRRASLRTMYDNGFSLA